jgi:glycine hydroxymethyltransferase
MTVAIKDPKISGIIEREQQRQEGTINLIASENYASRAVLEAGGSVLTNKYAEGYPGKRYYGGCQYVDEAEQCAIDRVCELFGAAYANVQPHSGSQANQAVYLSLLKPGDTILAMGLSDGGHLTHGSGVNFSGRLYQAVHYGVDPVTGQLDYDQILALAIKHQPQLIVAGFSAYSGELDWAQFRKIADKVGAWLLVDMAHIAGLVAAKLTPSPVPYADVVTSTTHKTLRGPRGGLILGRAHDTLPKKINFGVFPCNQGGPFMHAIAAKAVAFKEAMSPEFVAYQQQVVANAKTFANALMAQGFKVVSGGTLNHQCTLDFSDQAYSGRAIEQALDQAGISVNKNTVPGEKKSPQETSGIRMGTPALTTRGFKEQEMKQVAAWIGVVCADHENQEVLAKVRQEVAALVAQFPIYKD